MPQDAFTLRINAAELNETLKLILSSNARDCGAYFTEDERENPLVAPNFCMLLRKHLQSAEILEVTMPDFERILCFKFLCTSDFSSCERILYAEIMGKYSNLILTENGIILGALKMTSLDENTKRTVFAGAKYTLPEPQDKVNPSDTAALRNVLTKAQGDLGRFLFTRVAGLASATAELIAATYRGGDLTEHVTRFIFSNECQPCVLERENQPVDFFARSLSLRFRRRKPISTLSGAPPPRSPN